MDDNNPINQFSDYLTFNEVKEAIQALAMAYTEQPFVSQMKNCQIAPRDGEVIFKTVEGIGVLANLDGYYVMPIHGKSVYERIWDQYNEVIARLSKEIESLELEIEGLKNNTENKVY